MNVKSIVGDDFGNVLAVTSLDKLSVIYHVGKASLRHYIITDEKLNKIYRSKARKDIIYHRKNEVPARKRKVRTEAQWNYCPTFQGSLNKESCKYLCETIIRKAIKDKDRYFFESDWYVFYQNLTSLTTTKEEYLKMVDERQCQE